jgi:transposase-like protein
MGVGVGGMKQPREVRLDAGATIDLRRRMVRERVHGLLEGSRLLPPEDQWLLGQHLGSGRSMASIARELGCSADVVRARVRRLIVRVESEVYGFVLERAEAQMSGWDAEVRAIARACIGRGMSMRGAARELGVGVHVVRARMLEVHAMLAAARVPTGGAARNEARGEARKQVGVGVRGGVRAGEAA